MGALPAGSKSWSCDPAGGSKAATVAGIATVTVLIPRGIQAMSALQVGPTKMEP